MRLALAGAHGAASIEAHAQFAHGVAVLPGLHDADTVAVFVGGECGVGALGAEAGVAQGVGAEQGVGVAADDHVHVAQAGGKLQVAAVGEVGQQDDFVDAVGFEAVDFALGGGGFIFEGGAGVGTRGGGGFAGDGQADDADALAVAGDDGRGLDALTLAAEWAAGPGLEVGAEHGGFAGTGVQEIDELAQSGVALVELMVAHGHGVEADVVHHGCVGAALFERVIQVAGEGVAGVEFEHVGPAGGQRFEGGGDAREAADVHGDRFSGADGVFQAHGGGVGVKARVVVVDVQQGEFKRFGFAAPAAAGAQDKGEGRRSQQAQAAWGEQGHGVAPEG